MDMQKQSIRLIDSDIVPCFKKKIFLAKMHNHFMDCLILLYATEHLLKTNLPYLSKSFLAIFKNTFKSMHYF